MRPSVLFSGPFFSALGWALFHFLWQGALVAGLCAAAAWLLRKRSPALRYALACSALATMVALPLATAWSLAGRTRDRAASDAQAAATPALAALPVGDGASNAVVHSYDHLSPDDLVAMWIHNVTADFVRDSKSSSTKGSPRTISCPCGSTT